MYEYEQRGDRVKEMRGGERRENLNKKHFVKDLIIDALLHKPQKS